MILAKFDLNYVRLPLIKSANILYENALLVDWNELVSNNGNQFETNFYILGNPFFVGGKMMDKMECADIARVAKDVTNYGLLDYICAWCVKVVKFLQNTKLKVAFISMNSITKGEQVFVLWQYLFDN